MESQPAAQGSEVSERCPCDDGRPEECPHVIADEMAMLAETVREHLTIAMEMLSKIERA